MATTWSLRQLFTWERVSGLGRRRVPEAKCTPEVVETGDFRIDLSRRSATLRGRELQLSTEEFDLLVFLAGHPKRLVTPRTRLATNWTGSALRQAEFIRVLQSLRKKLDAEGDSTQHYIQTEPWILYRFDPGASRTL